ncbi:MAG: radical SAM protein [Patescibacteria group bacterium]|nr:radical SAM protein [Patescibacteria group bacterium]
MEKQKKQVDILFVNPPVSQEERYGVKFKAGGQTLQTGLAVLAAITRQKGYDTQILDATALELDYEQTVKKIYEINPKYIGITAVTISIFNAVEIIRKIQKKNNNFKIFLGGPHITATPKETFSRFSEIKIGIIGEGDVTVLELLDAFENNKDLSGVKGIIYRKAGDVAQTEVREPFMDLDSLPMPAWDLFPDLPAYYYPPAHTVKRFPATVLITSRGCPGQCTFCDNKVFGRKLRCYSADYVIRMIRYLQDKYGMREIQFRDDNFLVFRQRMVELCNRIIDEKMDIVWSCAGRVDMIDEEMLALMKKAGCWQIWFGVESGSDKVLKAIKKNTSVEKIKRAIKLTKQAGISPCGFFMIGMPTETEEDIKKTIDLLLELPIDEFHMTHLTPLPGSEIHATAREYGYFEDNWKKMSNWSTVFVPKGLTKEKLTHYSNLAFRKFYFRPRIILQYLLKIRTPRHFIVYFKAFLGLVSYITQKQR